MYNENGLFVASDPAVIQEPVIYQMEYCNDTTLAQTGLFLDLEFPVNWVFNEIKADPGNILAGLTPTINGNTLSY